MNQFGISGLPETWITLKSAVRILIFGLTVPFFRIHLKCFLVFHPLDFPRKKHSSSSQSLSSGARILLDSVFLTTLTTGQGFVLGNEIRTSALDLHDERIHPKADSSVSCWPSISRSSRIKTFQEPALVLRDKNLQQLSLSSEMRPRSHVNSDMFAVLLCWKPCCFRCTVSWWIIKRAQWSRDKVQSSFLGTEPPPCRAESYGLQLHLDPGKIVLIRNMPRPLMSRSRCPLGDDPDRSGMIRVFCCHVRIRQTHFPGVGRLQQPERGPNETLFKWEQLRICSTRGTQRAKRKAVMKRRQRALQAARFHLLNLQEVAAEILITWCMYCSPVPCFSPSQPSHSLRSSSLLPPLLWRGRRGNWSGVWETLMSPSQVCRSQLNCSFCALALLEAYFCWLQNVFLC